MRVRACTREYACVRVCRANDTYPSIPPSIRPSIPLRVLCQLMKGCNPTFSASSMRYSSVCLLVFPGARMYQAIGYWVSIALFVAPAALSCGGVGLIW